MPANIEVDEVWRCIGIGKYQVLQFFLWIYGTFCLGAHYMLMVFMGFRPKHQCSTVNIEDILPSDNYSLPYDSYHITYDKCDIHVYTNNTNSTEVTSTGCIAGYSYPVDKHLTIVTEWNLVCKDAGLAELSQSLFLVGHGVGLLISPPLADRFGRKKIFIYGSVSLFVLTVILMLVQDIIAFNVIRFLIGISGQSIEGSYIMFLEMVPMELRMHVEVFTMVTWTCSSITLGTVAYLLRNTTWRYLELTFALLNVHVLLLPWLLDESVRWLLANGRHLEAHRIIKKASRWNNKTYEDVINQINVKTSSREKHIQNFKSDTAENMSKTHVGKIYSEEQRPLNEGAIENGSQNEAPITFQSNVYIASQSSEVYQSADYSSSHRYNVCNIFKDRRIFLNTLMLSFLWITNVFIYYCLTLGSSSLDGNRFMNFILLNIVEFPGIVLEFILLNRIGRRKLLILLYLLSGVSLLCATLFSFYQDTVESFSTASRVATFIGKMGIAACLSVVWLYTAEIYPTNLRAVGSAIASLSGDVGGFIAPFALLLIATSWGPSFICTTLGLVSIVFVYLLPETLGHELPTTITEVKLRQKGTQLQNSKRTC